MRPNLLAILCAFALPLSACNCNSHPNTIPVVEAATVVEGSPAVDSAKPTVKTEPTPTPPEFKLNVPRQCDFFEQNAVRKVDILWVVDNSGSMQTSQQNLANQFPKFITSLLSLQPPVDFHIGVASIDTDNDALTYAPRDGDVSRLSTVGTKGALHGFDLSKDGGAIGRFIACDSVGNCNVPKLDPAGKVGAAEAFAQMAKVGTGGSAVERGLYASYLALNRDDNTHPQDPSSGAHCSPTTPCANGATCDTSIAGGTCPTCSGALGCTSIDIEKRLAFIRADAALFVIYVSDEDDSSCAPFVKLNPDGHPADGQPCTTDPGCRCNALNLSWGSPQYFSRFLESYKGTGHGDLVAAGAVVCTEKQIIGAQNGDPAFAHLGCPDHNPPDGGVGEVAYYGDRYIQVAANTGGTAISIRGNFANALQSLGFAVSGLRNDFRLSRGPFTDSLEAYLTQVNAKKCTLDNECPSPQKCRSGACATQITVGARNFGACVPSVPPPWDGGTAPPLVDYCKCDSGAFRNIMRFPDAPPAQSSIEICYDVNSNFNQACQ